MNILPPPRLARISVWNIRTASSVRCTKTANTTNRNVQRSVTNSCLNLLMLSKVNIEIGMYPSTNKKLFSVESNEENLCTYYDEDDCRFAYVYYFDENEVRIRAQEKPECPPKVFLLGIVLGVIAAIVLMGLAILLLWKLLTTIHDRREFAKFEKERMMAKWDTVSITHF